MKFRKSEIARMNGAVRHIQESLKDGTHDFWSALYCAGFTFIEDIKRFCNYTSQIDARTNEDSPYAPSISETILEKYPEWI